MSAGSCPSTMDIGERNSRVDLGAGEPAGAPLRTPSLPPADPAPLPTASAPPLLLVPEHLQPTMTHLPARLLYPWCHAIMMGRACSISSPLALLFIDVIANNHHTPPSRQVPPSISGPMHCYATSPPRQGSFPIPILVRCRRRVISKQWRAVPSELVPLNLRRLDELKLKRPTEHVHPSKRAMNAAFVRRSAA
ncbi:hypothetical protein BDN70DRAFT_992847 [Pholiota conissans]|uniref:Uncharacterized protein n=1 Tax=Pholiota conissans TaxID=109636 RepID=A0A9P5Z4S1_9AGAR|nr:hypothetical protein BDN70DRAFT_992847 [Pholiota conissans]